RSNRRTPSDCSRLAICAVSVGWLTPSLSAARLKLCAFDTATKYSSWRSDTRRGLSGGASMIAPNNHLFSFHCLAGSRKRSLQSKLFNLPEGAPVMEQVVSGAVSFRKKIFPKHRELFAELANGQRP